MEIKLNPGLASVDGTVRKRPATPQATAAGSSSSFSGAQALNQALEATPETRADAVRRAQALVSQTSYPPPELINGIAKLLAAKLTADSE
jgi:hypothetical protein